MLAAISMNTAEIKIVRDDDEIIACRISENELIRLASHVDIPNMNGMMPAPAENCRERRRHIFIKQKIHDAFLIGITR